MKTGKPAIQPNTHNRNSFQKRNSRRRLLIEAILSVAGAVMLATYVPWLLVNSEVPAPLIAPAGETVEGHTGFSFAVVGDNRGNMSVFEEILSRIKGEHVSFILHTGDIVKRPNKRQFDWVLHEIGEEQLSVPLYAVPGNHDIDKDAGDASTRYRFYNRAFGLRHYWFSYGHVLFVAFDDSTERCTKNDLRWLDSTLRQHKDKHELCFVYMHVPPRDPRPGHRHALEQGADGLVDVLNKHRVTAVFAGHIHGCLEDNIAGIPVFITGGAGASLHKNAGDSFNYLLCRVEPDGSFTVRKKNVDPQLNTDYPEYAFRTDFPGNIIMCVGASLVLAAFALRAHDFVILRQAELGKILNGYYGQ